MIGVVIRLSTSYYLDQPRTGTEILNEVPHVSGVQASNELVVVLVEIAVVWHRPPLPACPERHFFVLYLCLLVRLHFHSVVYVRTRRILLSPIALLSIPLRLVVLDSLCPRISKGRPVHLDTRLVGLLHDRWQQICKGWLRKELLA